MISYTSDHKISVDKWIYNHYSMVYNMVHDMVHKLWKNTVKVQASWCKFFCDACMHQKSALGAWNIMHQNFKFLVNIFKPFQCGLFY